MSGKVKCFKCHESILSADGAECSECDKTYHFECSIPEQSYKKMNKNKKTWKCPKCTTGALTRNRMASNMTQDDTQTDLQEIKAMLKEMDEKLKGVEKIEIEIRDIKKIYVRIEKMENEIKEFKTTVEFMASKYDDIIEVSNKNKQSIKTMEANIEELKASNKKKDELFYMMANLELNQRSRNVEVHGIDENRNEDCALLIEGVAKELNLDIRKSDVDIAHRVRFNKRPNSSYIIAQFKTRSKKEIFSSKKFLNICNNNIPGTELGSKIFINDNLTQFHRSLLGQTKSRARELNYKFAWYKHGKIMVRKNEESRVIIINKEEDLFNLSNDINSAYGSANA